MKTLAVLLVFAWAACSNNAGTGDSPYQCARNNGSTRYLVTGTCGPAGGVTVTANGCVVTIDGADAVELPSRGLFDGPDAGLDDGGWSIQGDVRDPTMPAEPLMARSCSATAGASAAAPGTIALGCTTRECVIVNQVDDSTMCTTTMCLATLTPQ